MYCTVSSTGDTEIAETKPYRKEKDFPFSFSIKVTRLSHSSEKKKKKKKNFFFFG